MYEARKAAQAAQEITRNNIQLLAIRESRWNGSG